MAENGKDTNKLIEEAIDASMDFEELMDKTDFDSWLNGEKLDELEEQGQDVASFKKFEENINNLEKICDGMITKGNNKSPESIDKSSFKKDIINNLFESKNKRLKARLCSKKKEEQEEYKKAIYHLLSALNPLQKPKGDNKDKRRLILIYNDLSICYAGLENSSMSRGYAEEARWIVEKKEESYAKSYKEFCQKFSTDNSTNRKDIKDHDFVSSRLFELYIVALFNQAEAERRSYLYTDAEKNFKKIIEYAEYVEGKKRDTPHLNFNYYSALLKLGDLYIDLGRGNEAIELLNKAITKLDENDIRYWNVYLGKINALIDQTEYDDARNLLYKNIIERENGFTLSKRHRITSTGFKGLNCFVRCIIENVSNNLEMNGESKKYELEKAEKIIYDNIDIIIKRTQKGLETKAYKQLGDIYNILGRDEDVRKYLTKFISETEIDDLDEFISNPKMGKWIDKCDDLDALESFTGQIIKVITDETIDNYRDLLDKIKEKITKECEDKDQLSRAERDVRQIKEVLRKKKDIKYKEGIFLESSCGEENLTKGDIYKRLDINEKEFDKVLFERSEIKEKKHIAEVIILRRWNSFSPGLYRESTGSLGGGYLLRINKCLMGKNEKVENIVIDPGYNFLQNFRREGFYINNIDTIIVTHSHLDHCAELLPIMDLMYQFNKRYKDTSKKERQRKKVNLCLSQGAYKRFSSYIDEPDWKKQLKDVIILENLHNNKYNSFKDLAISAIQTPHMDLGGVNAIGLKIEISIGKENLCLGFTGDTPFYPKIKEHFKGCDLLCVHLGSIKYQEIGYTDDRYNLKSKPRKISSEIEQREKFDEKYATANHLLFFGTLEFIEYCAKKDEPLIIVSEFGEELKYELRTDLCKKLWIEANKKRKENKIPDIDCLPGDIGLYIGIEKDGTKKVRCNFCEHFVKPKEIETFSYGREDAIHYICQTCGKTLSELQKQAFIEHRVTRH